MDRKQVIDVLSSVIDPEIGMDIVTLGLIYFVAIKDEKIEVTMTLTFPGCPLASMMMGDVQMKLESVAGAGNVKVNLVFEPKWTQTMVSEQNNEKLLEEENGTE
ncbi:TPA: aromatic ring hydroxylase [candidate division WOR-3 bacterium]|uniref:Aromatic ring hydroxylase n=1 Tax=candidate division WOR-3 bacterium TaxID=2052148 RepID=A0A350H8M7_UNCW3|nr:aromatic ring hydroxylase [candidate division WOR-3 bacterium]